MVKKILFKNPVCVTVAMFPFKWQVDCQVDFKLLKWHNTKNGNDACFQQLACSGLCWLHSGSVRSWYYKLHVALNRPAKTIRVEVADRKPKKDGLDVQPYTREKDEREPFKSLFQLAKLDLCFHANCNWSSFMLSEDEAKELQVVGMGQQKRFYVWLFYCNRSKCAKMWEWKHD